MNDSHASDPTKQSQRDQLLTLLWAMVHVPEAIDWHRPDKMLVAIEAVASDNVLTVDRAQLHVILCELFTKYSCLIVGNIEHADGEIETICVELSAPSAAQARQTLEETLLQEYGAGWNWVAPPTITRAAVLLDVLHVDIPTTDPDSTDPQNLNTGELS